jgi:hypothetical protein
VPPEVAEEVAREEARIAQKHGFQIAPEARKRMTDDFTLFYYYEGSEVVCRTTPRGLRCSRWAVRRSAGSIRTRRPSAGRAWCSDDL